MGRIRLGSVAGLMGGQYATIANVTTENVTAKNLDGNAVLMCFLKQIDTKEQPLCRRG